MKLFIANTTKQNIDFLYRVPEQSGLRTQHIPIGGQIQVSGDLSTQQIEAIVNQHAPYGLIREDEIDRTKPFIGMCYAVDHPVSISKIERVVAHNTNVLILRGKNTRQLAAVAEANLLQNQLEDEGRQERLGKLEMSIVEENPDPRSENKPIAEGVRVVPPTPDDKGQSRGRRRKQ